MKKEKADEPGGWRREDCMRHTPGPWSVQPIGDETEANILGARRELVATVADYDAHLIAAAPELLKMLKLVHPPHPPVPTPCPACGAIAKAEGRS
jgi:hypothetical protein